MRDGATVSESTLIDTLKTRIANFKVPKRVHFVAELPRNTMGKVQKSRLRDSYADAFDSRAPRS